MHTACITVISSVQFFKCELENTVIDISPQLLLEGVSLFGFLVFCLKFIPCRPEVMLLSWLFNELTYRGDHSYRFSIFLFWLAFISYSNVYNSCQLALLKLLPFPSLMGTEQDLEYRCMSCLMISVQEVSDLSMNLWPNNWQIHVL